MADVRPVCDVHRVCGDGAGTCSSRQARQTTVLRRVGGHHVRHCPPPREPEREDWKPVARDRHLRHRNRHLWMPRGCGSYRPLPYRRPSPEGEHPALATPPLEPVGRQM